MEIDLSITVDYAETLIMALLFGKAAINSHPCAKNFSNSFTSITDCDEHDAGWNCGTNGKCTYDCLCCEGSDSDGGINVLVKGTTTGTRLEGGSYTCQTQTDSCQDSSVVREWYVDYLRLLVYRDYDCRQRTDGKIRCADGRCVECTKDDDCKDASGNWRYDPVNHTKIVCDCPSASCTYKPKINDYTCKALPKCGSNAECEPGWCCVDNPPGVTSPNPGTGKCVKGIYSGDSKYLCDPPDWNSEEVSKKQTLLDLILNFFSSLFS